MKRIVLTSVLALAAAAPAFAGDQLARNLGFEPGVYTTAELATIKGVGEAPTGTDAVTAASLATLFGNGVVSTQSAEGTASAQLAANLGLEPGVYTTAELATIKGVREAATGTDAVTAASLATLYAGGVVSTQSAGSGATDQLARSLGLDAADFSLADLAVLKGDYED